MGSSISKQSGRKLAKTITESPLKRTPDVNQIPKHTPLQQSNDESLNRSTDESFNQVKNTQSSLKFDPKYLSKKLNNKQPDKNTYFEGKDGLDPHEQGTSTYDQSFISSINKLGKQIKSVDINLITNKESISIDQLKSRSKLYQQGEEEIKGSSSNNLKTMVHPQTLTAILKDLKDPKVNNDTILEDYKLAPNFLEQLGTRFEVPTNEVPVEDVVKEGEIGHGKPHNVNTDNPNESISSESFDNLKKRISLDE